MGRPRPTPPAASPRARASATSAAASSAPLPASSTDSWRAPLLTSHQLTRNRSITNRTSQAKSASTSSRSARRPKGRSPPPLAAEVGEAATSGSRASWLLAAGCLGRRRRRPTKARPQLIGHDLDHRAGAPVLRRPAPLLESAHDHDPAALGQRLGGMLGLVAPRDHGEERRLLLPTATDGHPEHGPGDPCLGVADLGILGEVAGKAHGCLGHASALLELSGRAVCPALGPGGRWTPWHAERTSGASGGANEVGHGSRLPADGRLGCRVGWWGACGWGSGMPAPSGQIPPPWAWWENEAPATRAARRPVPGSSRRVFLHRVGCHR